MAKKVDVRVCVQFYCTAAGILSSLLDAGSPPSRVSCPPRSNDGSISSFLGLDALAESFFSRRFELRRFVPSEAFPVAKSRVSRAQGSAHSQDRFVPAVKVTDRMSSCGKKRGQ